MRFSIVTICYNAENEIKETMESVLNQNFKDMEYIVIDGGSKDKTNEIVESMRKRFDHSGVELVHVSEPDKGISDAFNKGIMRSHGDIVGLINAGDQYAENTLKRVDSQFDAGSDIVYGNILWKDDACGMDYVRYAKKSLRTVNLEMCVLHPASFIKRNAYERAGLYNTAYSICMDRDLFSRMHAAGMKFQYVNEVFSVMKAGGISDQEKRQSVKRSEGLRIALARGVPQYVYDVFYWIKRAELKGTRLIKKYLPFIYKLKQPKK